MSDNLILSVENLSVSYGPIVAVRGVSLDVYEGEIVAVLGSNGAGKSTTLLAMAGLLQPASGSIQFLGSQIQGESVEKIARSGLALVPEGRRIFEGLTVLENLRIGAASKQKAEFAEARDEVFELFPILAERRGQHGGTLSGGEQQMLAIGRAMMSKPRLMLLDEPSLGLAPRIVDTIFDLIASLRDKGTTILLVEQNVRLALEIADRGYVISLGSIAASGTSAELKGSDEVAKAYLGAA